MLGHLDEVRSARVPASSVAGLAGLRGRDGVCAVRDADGSLWVTWGDADSNAALEAVLVAPGVVLFERRGGAWHERGASLPAFDVPTFESAATLAHFLFPARFVVEPPPDNPGEAVAVRLVADDRPRVASALRCGLDRLARWADTATTAEFEGLRAATRDDRAMVVGHRLPPIAGAERFWGARVLVPLGLRPDPSAVESLLREAAGAADDELLVLTPAGAERVPVPAFTPLGRAGVRLAAPGLRGEGSRMIRPGVYLRIPEVYVKPLGAPRWCGSGEAIEYVDDQPPISLVFAMAGDVGRFLDGFMRHRPPPNFGHVIHFLHLLGMGRGGAPEWSEPLARAFTEARRSFTHAGAFCARLCAEAAVPTVPLPPERLELARVLTQGPAMAALAARWRSEPWAFPAIEPRLEPEGFEAKVRQALAGFDRDDLVAWLRTGRGPARRAAEVIAEAVEQGRPQSLTGLMAAAACRPRLAPAAAMVANLAGALALPPRRLADRELPLGGYFDVTTRGGPEQILPSQFALEPAEFLRRFAANELLYFHREEPHTPRTRELLVVLDQGVRTWGDVRLMLAAAVMALARHAERAGLAFRVATTGANGGPHDPLRLTPGALGTLLESSDLSADPGAALARALARSDDFDAETLRDVVLLTHPRNLSAPAVVAAAAPPAGTRLFAVAVDAQGEGQLATLKPGAAVAVGRFRVEPPADAPPTAPPAVVAPPADGWTGDVEPIPFPFEVGISFKVQNQLFALDHEGRWLLACSMHGVLHAIASDGHRQMLLPRGMYQGRVLNDIRAIVGVAGGFAVVGDVGPDRVLAHYDLDRRTCRVSRVSNAFPGNMAYDYVVAAHTVIQRPLAATPAGGHVETRVDLVNGDVQSAEVRWDLPPVQPPLAMADRQLPELPPSRETVLGPSYQVTRAEGTIQLLGVTPPWETFRPISDGRPLMADQTPIRVQLRGRVLAMLLVDSADGRPRASEARLHLFRGPHGDPIGEVRMMPGCPEFALSGDGSRLVRRSGWRQFHVRDAENAADRGFVTRNGRYNRPPSIEAGEGWLVVRDGGRIHMFRWDRDHLEVEVSQGTEPNPGLSEMMGDTIPFDHAEARHRPPQVAYDHQRWMAGCTRGATLAVDLFGQVAIFDRSGELAAMIMVYRRAYAAWLPDGTRFGSTTLNGGPETPDAARRIGQALARATGIPGRPRR